MPFVLILVISSLRGAEFIVGGTDVICPHFGDIINEGGVRKVSRAKGQDALTEAGWGK